MYANLSPGPNGISHLSPIELIELAARHGFGGVDLILDQVRTVDEAAALGERARNLGLRWGIFWMPCDFPSADAADHAEGLRRLREILPLVRAAGCTRTYNHLLPGQNDRDAKAQAALHRERLRPVADLLGEYGVTYGLEFIGPLTLQRTFRYPYLRSLPELNPLLDVLGPNVGVVLDTFHWWTSGGTLESLKSLLSGRIVNVHANDGRAGRTAEEQLDGEREMPLTSGLIDAVGVLRVLAGLGYEGPVIAEPFSPQRDKLAAMRAEDAAATVSASLFNLFAASQITEGVNLANGAATTPIPPGDC